MGSTTCQECHSIAEELAAAYADLWASSDQAFKEAWIATYKMIGGTEDDAERAEEILGGFRSDPLAKLNPDIHMGYAGAGSVRIRDAVLRKCKHQVLTGHKVPAAPYS